MTKPIIDLRHQQFVSAMRGVNRYNRGRGVSVDLRPLFKTVFGSVENSGRKGGAKGYVEEVRTPTGNRGLKVVTATGYVDYPIRYSDGRIGYDNPGRVPKYLKVQVQRRYARDEWLR